MYRVIVKTTFNTIELYVDDLSEYQELFVQPYVIEVYIQSMEQYKKVIKKQWR